VHESTLDLSPYLEIHRARDRAVNVFLALFGWLPLARTPVGHLVGGSALQTCLERGWIGYEMALFQRVRQTQDFSRTTSPGSHERHGDDA
jgi:hypothetical protein